MTCADLRDVIRVELEAENCRGTEIDDRHTGFVLSNIETADDRFYEVGHVMPPLGVYGSGRVQHEHQVDITAARCMFNGHAML